MPNAGALRRTHPGRNSIRCYGLHPTPGSRARRLLHTPAHALSHPNILSIYELVVVDGIPPIFLRAASPEGFRERVSVQRESWRSWNCWKERPANPGRAATRGWDRHPERRSRRCVHQPSARSGAEPRRPAFASVSKRRRISGSAAAPPSIHFARAIVHSHLGHPRYQAVLRRAGVALPRTASTPHTASS